MRKILERCPTCGGDLAITEVHCLRCATEVRSQYAPCPFCRLADDQITFLLLFVENRGNLSELEKQLGVSYPTIRNKLDEVIQVIRGGPGAPSSPDSERRRRGPETADSPSAPTAPEVPSTPRSPGNGKEIQAEQRRSILEQIAAGQIDPAEGLERLRRLGERND